MVMQFPLVAVIILITGVGLCETRSRRTVVLKGSSVVPKTKDISKCFEFHRNERVEVISELSTTHYSCLSPRKEFSRWQERQWFYESVTHQCFLEVLHFASVAKNVDGCFLEDQPSRSELVQASHKSLVKFEFRNTFANQSLKWLPDHSRYFQNEAGDNSIVVSGPAVLDFGPPKKAESLTTQTEPYLTLGSTHTLNSGAAKISLTGGNLTILRNLEGCTSQMSVASGGSLDCGERSSIALSCQLNDTSDTTRHTSVAISSTAELIALERSDVTVQDSEVVLGGALFLFDRANLSVTRGAMFLHLTTPIPRLDLVKSNITITKNSLLRIKGSISEIKSGSQIKIENDSNANIEAYVFELDHSELTVQDNGLIKCDRIARLELHGSQVRVVDGGTLEAAAFAETVVRLIDAHLLVTGARTLLHVSGGGVDVNGNERPTAVGASGRVSARLHLFDGAELVIRRGRWRQYVRSTAVVDANSSVLVGETSDVTLDAGAVLIVCDASRVRLGVAARVDVALRAGLVVSSSELMLASRAELLLEADARLALATNSRLLVAASALVRVRGACTVNVGHGSTLSLHDRAVLLFLCQHPDDDADVQRTTVWYSRIAVVLPEYARVVVDLRNETRREIHLDRLMAQAKDPDCDLSKLMSNGRC